MAKFNKHREKPLVLLSPLNWGLGHTTRCIPLIRELLQLECNVIVACTAAQKSLLELEFQAVNFLLLPEGGLTYGRNRFFTLVQLLFQTPKFLTRIKRENRWLQQLMNQQPVDAIISDNRFGLSVPGIPCIFITHQLQIITGLGVLMDRWAQRINYRFINRFTTCWVPDYKEGSALAGKLSNPSRYPKTPVQYIGALSRFEYCTGNENPGELLIILSGPEPQRSMLEKKIVAGLRGYSGTVHLVRGLPDKAASLEAPAGVQVYNHITATALNRLICSAEWVIGRSGYTTVMDLLKLHKKAILIPTPGQAEQEYLANLLHSRGLAWCIAQQKFSLPDALQAANSFPFCKVEVSMEEYKTPVEQFVQALRSGANRPE